MISICKYPIEIDLNTKTTFCNLPKNAKILSVTHKESFDIYEAYLYAIVNTDNSTEKREVLWLGTGGPISIETQKKIEKYIYLGTFETSSYNLTWHFWIEPEPEQEK